jgi:hypothetical protein
MRRKVPASIAGYIVFKRFLRDDFAQKKACQLYRKRTKNEKKTEIFQKRYRIFGKYLIFGEKSGSGGKESKLARLLLT